MAPKNYHFFGKGWFKNYQALPPNGHNSNRFRYSNNASTELKYLGSILSVQYRSYYHICFNTFIRFNPFLWSQSKARPASIGLHTALLLYQRTLPLDREMGELKQLSGKKR